MRDRTPRHHARTLRRCVLGTIVGVALVACGADEGDLADEPAATEDPAAEPATEDVPDEAPEDDVDLAVGETELGEVLVDGDGMTLYLFTQDPPGESVCDEECQEVWPPALVDGEPQVGEGVDAGLVSTLEREDGTQQLLYDDAPLYGWTSDQEPGDVTGQEVQGVWFVVAPDGTVIGADDDADDDAGSEDADDVGDAPAEDGYGEEEGSSRPSY